MINETILSKRAEAPSKENDKSSYTYSFLRNLLLTNFWNDVDIFLQWSYANSTNIKKDSDIDIVICYKNVYFYNIDSLSDIEKNYFNKNLSQTSYTFFSFKQDVQNFLEQYFWNKVERKKKCIRINLWDEKYVDADIVPCFIHKRFYKYNSIYDNDYVEWIEFFSDDLEDIISFPKIHKKNGETKNQSTDGVYKDMVRIMKNSKKYLVDNWKMDEKFISSFMIECCIRNVSNNIFSWSSYKNIVNNVMGNIYSDMQNLKKCENYREVCGLFPLFWWNRNKNTPQEVMNFLEEIYILINK